ncbi:Beta-glucuronosyltransferase GlcAT14B-like protein [Drosera capensis]
MKDTHCQPYKIPTDQTSTRFQPKPTPTQPNLTRVVALLSRSNLKAITSFPLQFHHQQWPPHHHHHHHHEQQPLNSTTNPHTMKRLKTYYTTIKPSPSSPINQRRWIFPLAIGSVVSLFLLFLTTLTSTTTTATTSLSFLFRPSSTAVSSIFVESKLRPIPISVLPPPPRIAYFVSGSAGDGRMLERTLLALYHPRNEYVVHLDLEAGVEERVRLGRFVRENEVFRRFGNVRVIPKANLVTYRGPTMVANTLNAAAILLREGGGVGLCFGLSARDARWQGMDLLHTFSYLPRDLNFIDHTSNIGWKEFQRAKPIIIDPGLYMTKKSDVFWVTQRRSVPTAFKLFTESLLCTSGKHAE